MTGNVLVSVNTTGVSATRSDDPTVHYDVSGKGTEDDPYVITITNSSGEVLPVTGGPGTTIYTLCGLGLMTISAVMYSFAMRRKKEEERRFN